MRPIYAIGDDLNAVAVQDINRTETWNRLKVWNFTKGTNPRFVQIPGDLAHLHAVQLVNGKAWLLLSKRMEKPDHPKALLVDEEGKPLAETEMFGMNPIVDGALTELHF